MTHGAFADHEGGRGGGAFSTESHNLDLVDLGAEKAADGQESPSGRYGAPALSERDAVAKVAEKRKNLRWLEVVETRCHLENEAIAHWQVTVRIGVRAE